MNNEMLASKSREDVIVGDVIHILENMTYDWDMDFDEPLGFETRLIADLEFGSIDVVQFLVAIEEHYQSRGFPFEELVMVDGRYVDEIRVADVVTFLCRHMND